MKGYITENAAGRKSYVGDIFNEGAKKRKQEILSTLKSEWSELHRDGHIHIHDLDAYGETYNCLALNVLNKFPYAKFTGQTETRKIIGLFNFYIDTLTKLGNEQSGGMAFANFDNDTALILLKLEVELNDGNKEIIRDCIGQMIQWCNDCHERMGQVSYYVTLNIGLANSDFARFIAETVMSEFEKAGSTVFKPNIVFKVKKGVNLDKGDTNYFLLQKSLLCSAKKMIPTYLLCDSAPNKIFDSERLAIMGCRTRVVQDIHGHTGSIGRGNIDNITINLPRIALDLGDLNYIPMVERFDKAQKHWKVVASVVKDILIDRYNRLIKNKKPDDFLTNSKLDLWGEDFSSAQNLEQIFRHGTLSIGYIGLSEMVEILSGVKYYEDQEAYLLAYQFVQFMRNYCDRLIKECQLNFSLLATSGELISGRFPEIDKEYFNHDCTRKGFYTNSFYINVDSGISAFEKIEKEAPFHELSNGGCITYVELGEAPIGNDEALMELISQGIGSGTSYLGFNFPLDICNVCGEQGVFDKCEQCDSESITRIRRVSGYLEILDYFTTGKKNEENARRRN